MLPQSLYIIKARTWPIWMIVSLVGLPAILLMVTEPGNKAGPYLFAAAIVFGAILFLMSRTLRIEIDNERLSFFAYGRKRSMRWSEMKASRVSWAIEGGHSASFNWIFLAADGKTIDIPLGYYSRRDMQTLANQTIERATNATISNAIHGMAEGRFPWFLF